MVVGPYQACAGLQCQDCSWNLAAEVFQEDPPELRHHFPLASSWA